MVENIAEHSLQVAIIAHLLANIRNVYFGGNVNPDNIATKALYHDANETMTGDMPTPIKYFNPEIKDAYKNIEYVANKKLLTMLPKKLQNVYKDFLFSSDEESNNIIKAADKISAYIKCIEEEQVGNMEFKKAKSSIYKQIKLLKLPEVKFFMNKFMPSINLTLDELE